MSVPTSAATGAGFTGDVTASQVTDSTALDTKPDARQNPPAEANAAQPTPAADTQEARATRPRGRRSNGNYEPRQHAVE